MVRISSSYNSFPARRLTRSASAHSTPRPVSRSRSGPLKYWQMVLHGKENENPFCALMAQLNGSCAACLEVQQKIGDNPTDQPNTVKCFPRLTDAAVPASLRNTRRETLSAFAKTSRA